MQFRRFKLRFRRTVRSKRRQVEDLSEQAGSELETHFFERLGHLIRVRRFVLGWLLLICLLIGCSVFQLSALNSRYQTLQPAPGGIYHEGIPGSFTNANPLYATNEVDTTVSRLIFASLFTYNDSNKLVGDLADSWQVNAAGTVYTVHLRPHLTWQDGAPLTADDVVYTYHTIQDPDSQSPLYTSWQGVEVRATDAQTVTFTLPNPLSSFIYTLTNGIIPQHILGKVPAGDLRTAAFNTTEPVGAGPFRWQTLQVSGDTPDSAEQQIALVPFDGYHAGRPKLKEFVVNAFADKQKLIKQFDDNQLTAVAGLTDLPAAWPKDNSIQVYTMTVSAANMVFFNTESPMLKDANVRQGLVRATNVAGLLRNIGFPATLVREPFLKDQFSYQPRYAEAEFNQTQAAAFFKKAGWKMGTDGLLHKSGQILQFDMFAINNRENATVLQTLKQQWRGAGVNLRLHLQPAADFQNTLTSRSYDAVLNAIAVGVDPDVFVYWDSSQINPSSGGLNFSQYKSAQADTALEAGRTRQNESLRAIKYGPFLQAWQHDAPALALYQPRFLYVTRGPVHGLKEHTLNTDADRFSNVVNWTVLQARVTNP